MNVTREDVERREHRDLLGIAIGVGFVAGLTLGLVLGWVLM